ncbi:AI-2E family transporter [Pseudonocardia sp. DSM 45834]|uniref:AI-2E family transporter n=1 Tax=Pseudonocardia charpentierae TaxID=3075545 RepID=A0ABU2N834_9PSEU|nr:AI-2E family transporter [Pseudonocardia sp. DSM 45834]
MVLPRTLVILLELAAAVVIVAGIQAAAWLVGPVFLALVIVITVHPVQARLRGWGLPAWASTTLLVLAVYGVLLVLAGVVVVSIARLATLLPSYAAEFSSLLGSVTAELARFGVGADQLRALAGTLDYGRLVGVVSGLLLGLTSLLGNLVFLLSLLLFLSIEASGAADRLAWIARDRAPIATALTGFVGSTRRYMGVNTVFGLLTGLVDTVMLGLLGVPLAVLWGLLVFITNYIPYVGFWIGLVPPVLLALLTGGWQLAGIVLALYTVVNFVLTSVIQPKYVGDAVGISVSLTLVALVFWGWVLGVIGAVLAVPLTLFAKSLLVDIDPKVRWTDAILGSTTTARLSAAAVGPPPGDDGRPTPPPDGP